MKDDNRRDEDFLDEEEDNDTDSESIGNDEDDEIIESTEKKSIPTIGLPTNSEIYFLSISEGNIFFTFWVVVSAISVGNIW